MTLPPTPANSGTFSANRPESDLSSDPRWQLIERILQTNPFRKSTHLPALLSYLAKHAIREPHKPLNERQIGITVYEKSPDYSPSEDSLVRVHIRQLRLRIHEYFAQEGRNERLTVDIPKGSYTLDFQSVDAAHGFASGQLLDPTARPGHGKWTVLRYLLLVLPSIVAVVCAVGWYRAASLVRQPGIPWPLNEVIQNNRETRVVVSDSNVMLRRLGEQKELSLDEYLQPGFFKSFIPAHTNENVTRLLEYISESELTSIGDMVATSTMLQLAGPLATQMSVRSARSIHQRDLEEGNYVFVGSPVSNPWVGIYKDRLNFEAIEETVGGRMHFLNKHPMSGERRIYEGLEHTGSTGEDYATISILPSGEGQGNVMILQGLRQEGTEALAVFLANPSSREGLMRAVGVRDPGSKSVYFEVLIRASSVAGAPVSVQIEATRTI